MMSLVAFLVYRQNRNSRKGIARLGKNRNEDQIGCFGIELCTSHRPKIDFYVSVDF